jgi:hypothetical protein
MSGHAAVVDSYIMSRGLAQDKTGSSAIVLPTPAMRQVLTSPLCPHVRCPLASQAIPFATITWTDQRPNSFWLGQF